MLVEGPCEVDREKLLVIDGQSHQTPGKPEVAQVVGVNARMAVELESGSCVCVCVCVCVCARKDGQYREPVI